MDSAMYLIRAWSGSEIMRGTQIEGFR
jgi:hypothetical protein